MIFIHDETEIPTPKLKIVTKISLWERYEVSEVNGIKFIVGTSSLPESLLFEFKEFSSPIVLYELMSLYKNLPSDLFSCNQILINDKLSQKDISLVLSFCNKNGLPFWNNNLTSNAHINFTECENDDVAMSTIFHGIIPFSTKNMFPISSFINSLFFLHNDFLRIVAANNWDDDINVQILLSDNDREKIETIRKSQTKNNIIGLYTPNLNPFTTYWNDKEMCLQLNCENLMHLSTYHLCTLQQSQDFSGGYIKKCPKCNQLFVSSKPQQKFCNNPCTRQAYYSIKKKVNTRKE